MSTKSSPLEQDSESIGEQRVGTARRLLRRVESRPEPSPEARLTMLKKCNNSLTAFIAEAYTISTDDILKKDLESYWAYQHFYSARSRAIEACTIFAYEHAPYENEESGVSLLHSHAEPA